MINGFRSATCCRRLPPRPAPGKRPRELIYVTRSISGNYSAPLCYRLPSVYELCRSPLASLLAIARQCTKVERCTKPASDNYASRIIIVRRLYFDDFRFIDIIGYDISASCYRPPPVPSTDDRRSTIFDYTTINLILKHRNTIRCADNRSFAIAC